MRTKSAVFPALRAVHLTALADQIALTLETHRLQRELHAAMHSLQAAQRRLVEVEKLHVAGTLAASVAHDIRNIVAALQIEIEIPAHPRFGEPVTEQLNRFSALTHRLLAFARPHVLEMLPTSLTGLIQRIVPLIASQAEINNVTIEQRLPDDLPLVAADASQLEHLFVNLGLNAIQAMIARGGTLTFAARHEKPRWVSLRVEDTGCGIAPNAVGASCSTLSLRRVPREPAWDCSVAAALRKNMADESAYSSTRGKGAALR